MEGEVVMKLNRWGRGRDSLRVHIVRGMPREYDSIIGCDLLGLLGARVNNINSKWRIRIGRKRYRAHKLVGDSGKKIGAINRTEDWKETLRAEYRDIFFKEGDALGITGETLHEIPLKQEKVTYVKEGRYPQALRGHIREEIENLKKQGIIIDSTSPYNSPLWAVKKKSAPGEEKYRVVIDYRKLNENTVDEKYPIPRFEDILDRLSGARIFSTLDLKAGYHQIRMHPRDRCKTAFSFERGHYEFTRMPFGLKNAPITFQRLMDEFLRGVEESFCQVYMDDLLVFSPSESQHIEHLRRVFDRVREFGLKLSDEKSLLGKGQIKFLGHTISEEGVRPDKSKVEALQKMAIPRDVKGIRRLLGSLNYYRRFVPEMAEYLVPLNNLLKKGRKVIVTAEIETNIRKCIKRLQEEPILAFPDFTKQFNITTDASEYAVGAVLSQEGSGGDRPVAYASRRLTDAETRYSALERELLAIVWAVDHFRPYVFGRKFQVHTDHKPLQWVGKLKESSARMTRWKENLSQYNMDIVYKPGKENIVADWLSRAVIINAVEEDRGNPSGEPSSDIRQFIQEWTPEREGEGSDTSTERVGQSRAQENEAAGRPDEIEEVEDIINDKTRQIIWKTKTSGLTRVAWDKYARSQIVTIWSQPGIRDDMICRTLKDASKPGQTHHLYVGNSIVWEKIKKLWRTEQIGIDRTFVRCSMMVETIRDADQQREVTLAYHQGKTNHRGEHETLQALKRKYFWWGMAKTIKDTIGACEVCQKTKYDRHPPKGIQQETPTASAPLSDLQADTFTWKGHKWVTIIDLFSKAAMAYPIRERSSEAVMEALRTWFQFYGTPDRISSDAGREFDNSNIRTAMKNLDIRWHLNTPGHPKSRGGVERLHSTLSDHLRVYHVEQGLEPDAAMPRAIAAYNHSIHTSTGFAPFEMLFGLRERRRDSRDTVVDEEISENLVNNRIKLAKIWEKAQRKMEAEKSRRVARQNVNVKDVMGNIKIGTVVYRRIGSNRGKEAIRYEGPFRVVVIREHNLVTVESVKEPKKRRTVHIEQLKLPIGNDG